MILAIIINLMLAVAQGFILLLLLETNQKAKKAFDVDKNYFYKLTEVITFLVGAPFFFAPFWFDGYVNAKWPDCYNLWVGLTVNCIVFLGWFFIVFVPRMKRENY